MKTAIAFLFAIVIALTGAVGYLIAVPQAQAPAPGAASGTEHYNPENFYQPVTFGGNTVATSSQGTAVYTLANLLNTSLIQQTATGALTVTLPASSSLLSFIPKAGDTRRICITAATTKVTLAGGTGTDLNTASSTKDILVGGLGCLTFVRKTNTDIEALFVTGI